MTSPKLVASSIPGIDPKISFKNPAPPFSSESIPIFFKKVLFS